MLVTLIRSNRMLRQAARPRTHLLEMFRRIDGFANRADQSVDVARPHDKANRVFARDLRDLGVFFHHRDERPARRQDSVNLARHETSSGSRRERYEM